MIYGIKILNKIVEKFGEKLLPTVLWLHTYQRWFLDGMFQRIHLWQHTGKVAV